MQTVKTLLIISWIVAVVLFMPPFLFADTVYLFGKIGTYPIAATLDQYEGKLSGWYFYPSRAKQIRLAGTIDRQGVFRLEEGTTAGKKTGIFDGQSKAGPMDRDLAKGYRCCAVFLLSGRESRST